MRKVLFLLSAAMVVAVSCTNNQEYRNVALMKAASQSSARVETWTDTLSPQSDMTTGEGPC